MSEPLGKWMTVEKIERLSDGPPFWLVRGSDTRGLGHIEWYARWRQYVFAPYGGSVLNRGCLTDLARYCDERTKEKMGR